MCVCACVCVCWCARVVGLRKLHKHICPRHGEEDCQKYDGGDWREFYYGKHSCTRGDVFGNFDAKGRMRGPRNARV